MPAAFAIFHTWPELRNAEYEVVQRLLAAAKNINRPVVVVDNSGIVIWCSPELNLRLGTSMPPDSVEFGISLHFESPRTLDVFSYYAVWQPIDFYYDFGYQRTVDRLSSHNDLLSCDSDVADAHALNIFSGLGRRPLAPLPKLFHMVSEPYLEPNIGDDSKLFYIGINWERVGRPKGRFHETLVALDEKGLTTIYGPELIMGVAPWQGFNTYEGELPFDGHSVKKAINRAGICLALSSAPHKKSGIMSNRLFEGLAGGAAVIATPNPLIDKHFSEVVYLVDDSRGEEALGQMVLEAVREIRANTAEARRRVLEGQRILREVCSLERSIETLFDGHDARSSHFDDVFLTDANVTIILMDDYSSLTQIRRRIDEYRRQRRANINLHIVCDRLTGASLQGDSAGGAVTSISIHPCDLHPQAKTLDGIPPPPERTGAICRHILRGLDTPFFMFAASNEIVFSDHLATLAKALANNLEAAIACSGALRDTFNGPANRVRTFVESRCASIDAATLMDGPSYRARFMYRTSLTDRRHDDLLGLLDGEEHRYFQFAGMLHGPLAQTSYATYVVDEAITAPPRIGSMPVEFQHRAIQDAFANDLRSLSQPNLNASNAMSAQGRNPSDRSRANAAPPTARAPLDIGRVMPTILEGEGMVYIGAGFSHPETDHTWLASSRGYIEFAIADRQIAEELDIVLVASGRRSVISGREQHCTFIVNGMACAYLPVPEILSELRIRIPRDLITASREFRLELLPDHIEPASHKGALNDDRDLAIAVAAFGVMPQAYIDLPIFRPNMLHSCGEGELGSDALLRGFYEAEPSLTWVAGTSASIRFRTSVRLSRPILRLGLWGRRSGHGIDQTVSLGLNKRHLANVVVPDRQKIIDIPLDGVAPVGSQYNIELRLLHAETASDENGRLLDGRLLGLAITAIGVFEADSAETNGRSDVTQTAADDASGVNAHWIGSKW